MLKIRAIRLEHDWLSARVAVAVAARKPEKERSPYLARAEKSVRFLRKSDHQTGVAMGMAIEAALKWLTPESDRKAALALLEQAIGIADTEGAALLAESGRRWLGEHLGGDRGGELHARAELWMTGQDVKNPAALAGMIVPGFQSP